MTKVLPNLQKVVNEHHEWASTEVSFSVSVISSIFWVAFNKEKQGDEDFSLIFMNLEV